MTVSPSFFTDLSNVRAGSRAKVLLFWLMVSFASVCAFGRVQSVGSSWNAAWMVTSSVSLVPLWSAGAFVSFNV